MSLRTLFIPPTTNSQASWRGVRCKSESGYAPAWTDNIGTVSPNLHPSTTHQVKLRGVAETPRNTLAPPPIYSLTTPHSRGGARLDNPK